MMNNPNGANDSMLDDMSEEMIIDQVSQDLSDVPAPRAGRRDLPAMMRKIPVTLETPGEGRVLVVDGGGNLRRALVGGQLGLLAQNNGRPGCSHGRTCAQTRTRRPLTTRSPRNPEAPL